MLLTLLTKEYGFHNWYASIVLLHMIMENGQKKLGIIDVVEAK